MPHAKREGPKKLFMIFLAMKNIFIPNASYLLSLLSFLIPLCGLCMPSVTSDDGYERKCSKVTFSWICNSIRESSEEGSEV